jgi:hypothetical protein
MRGWGRVLSGFNGGEYFSIISNVTRAVWLIRNVHAQVARFRVKAADYVFDPGDRSCAVMGWWFFHDAYLEFLHSSADYFCGDFADHAFD